MKPTNLTYSVASKLTYDEYMGLKSSALRADSYKYSQAFQYPDQAQGYFGYIEARGSKLSLMEILSQDKLIEYLRPRLLLDENLCVNRFPLFGLQGWIKKVVNNPITPNQVEYFAGLMEKHGEPFNREGFENIVANYGGHMPVTIKALPEGTLCNTHTPQVSVGAYDPATYWFGGFVETQIHRATWYSTTVCAISYTIKNIIQYYLEQTGDLGGLPFKLHDFGMRGGSSEETCETGGLAHLVNFLGTDTVDALIYGAFAYSVDCAGYSIPASEHSTMTALGPLGEYAQMLRMLNQFPKSGIVACVTDSYNFFDAVSNGWCGELKQAVLDSGKILVIRPDSGDPVEINTWAIQELDKNYGSVVNDKGYKVLNHVRLIQGDGVCPEVIARILQAFMDLGYSADNIAFGMGGALLQKLDRDTLKYAMKCSALNIDNQWVDVYKDPVTDHGKRSLKGRVGTKRQGGVLVPCLDSDHDNLMRVVYHNGTEINMDSMELIRQRASVDPVHN